MKSHVCPHCGRPLRYKRRTVEQLPKLEMWLNYRIYRYGEEQWRPLFNRVRHCVRYGIAL